MPDKPLTIISPVACFPGDSSFLGSGQFLTLVTFTLYPFSRGHLYITGPKIDDIVDFHPELLSDRDNLDVKAHVRIYKKQREIAHHMGLLCRNSVPDTQPTLPAHSKANLDNLNAEYSADDYYTYYYRFR
ncbi:hypothetical protein NPX13_g4682 [Xylaria arbuscula]|uniref:Uncharacterized protein n=1 Tax=Xylaria arbuscula TaxID=114810 RepID=A0A9W8TLQ0_9PEZI|nr:hypothetical protein NPX13_g4682 [Xylaria arbuscula]